MFFVFLFHSVWVWVFLLHLVACGTLVLQPGIEPMPLQWNHGVLTAEPLENLWNHLLLASVSVSSSPSPGDHAQGIVGRQQTAVGLPRESSLQNHLVRIISICRLMLLSHCFLKLK